MLIYYISIIVIALVIAGVVLAKLHISKLVDNSKGLIYFVRLIFVFGIIDILWGLTYYDCFGVGIVGHKITSSLFFGMTGILSYGWFLYTSSLIRGYASLSKKQSMLWFMPALVIIFIVIANIWTNKLFYMNGTLESYDRGSWYIGYRLIIEGYYLVVIIKAFIMYRKVKENKRKYFAIFIFMVIPLLIECLQSFGALFPFTTLAYVTAILAIYIFVSVEGEDKVIKSAYYTNELALECITEFNQEIDYVKSMKLLLNKLGKHLKAEKVYIGDSNREAIDVDFIWENEGKKKSDIGEEIIIPIYINKKINSYVIAQNCLKIEYLNSKMLCETVAHFIAFKINDKRLSDDLNRTVSEKLQAIEASNKAKTTFLFNMSHDIRTPMNAILGFNEIARRNIDNKERVLEALDKAKVSGEHMLGIINDILEMSRIESGKVELNEEVIDVKEHILSFKDMFEIGMKEKRIDFQVVDETKEPFMYGDYLRITQVIANLLSNAMKFTPEEGQVILKCVEKPCEKEGYVSYDIRIKDTGIGMSEEFQKKAFKSFEREKTSTNSQIEGTGLGLAIAKSIAVLIGGDLTCTSKIGKGTEFIFTFKARIAKSGKELIKKAENRALVLKDKRILVAEDNELNREIATEILRAEGCIIEEAENGMVAVEKLVNSKAGYYDLILMDIQMPIMNGYEAVSRIRTIENKELANIPIIAMTANAFEEDKKKALEVGMNAHVSKPIDIDKLLGSMMELLQNEE